MFLIHTPRGGDILDVWGHILEAKESGVVKHAGVSNFGAQQLREMRNHFSLRQMPEVNQIEFHPFFQPTETIEVCKEMGIVVEGYCPLTRTRHLSHPAIQKISHEYKKTPAQILLAWSLQNGVITIPKSSDRNHIQENVDALSFTLEKKDFDLLKKLNCGGNVSRAPPAMNDAWAYHL